MWIAFEVNSMSHDPAFNWNPAPRVFCRACGGCARGVIVSDWSEDTRACGRLVWSEDTRACGRVWVLFGAAEVIRAHELGRADESESRELVQVPVACRKTLLLCNRLRLARSRSNSITFALDLPLIWFFPDFENAVDYTHAGHHLPERRKAHAVQSTVVSEIDKPRHVWE